MPAKQAKNPEFKSQYSQRERERERKYLILLLKVVA
jgi:hypothetical protein